MPDSKPEKRIVEGFIEPIRLSGLRVQLALDAIEGGRRGRGEMPDQDEERKLKQQKQKEHLK